MRRYLFGAALLVLLGCASAFAQQTTGNITGRVVDQQGAAIPGATVTAKNPPTGFTRTEVSDAEGVYRLTRCRSAPTTSPPSCRASRTVSKKDVEVNVAPDVRRSTSR